MSLTESGRQAALAVVRRHRLLETFLVRELGYGWDEVHDEAEILEHAVSDMMLDRIDAKLGHPTRDPHGDPIPAADGRVPTPPARQLSDCTEGELGTVAGFPTPIPRCCAISTRWESAWIRASGFWPAATAGIISVSVESADRRGSNVELGSPAAQAIWVIS